MKNLLTGVLTFFFACQNPEEKATTITDTAATYNQGAVYQFAPLVQLRQILPIE